MAVMTDWGSFMEEVGRLIDPFEIERLGILGESLGSLYVPSELPKLREFCAKHPDFHIIAQLAPLVMVNRDDPRGTLFMLGNGNPDPTIYCVHPDPGYISLEEAIKDARG